MNIAAKFDRYFEQLATGSPVDKKLQPTFRLLAEKSLDRHVADTKERLAVNGLYKEVEQLQRELDLLLPQIDSPVDTLVSPLIQAQNKAEADRKDYVRQAQEIRTDIRLASVGVGGARDKSEEVSRLEGKLAETQAAAEQSAQQHSRKIAEIEQSPVHIAVVLRGKIRQLQHRISEAPLSLADRVKQAVDREPIRSEPLPPHDQRQKQIDPREQQQQQAYDKQVAERQKQIEQWRQERGQTVNA